MKASIVSFLVAFLTVYTVASYATGDLMMALAFEVVFALGIGFAIVADAFDR